MKTKGASQHFKTITDSHFSKGRQSQNPLDQELLKNHYKFHKGTSYTIGRNEHSRSGSRTLAQESFVPKARQD